jgi:hypothetical protein
LLDWRLGLDFLSLLRWHDFESGLNDNFQMGPGIRDWPRLATMLRDRMLRRFGGEGRTLSGLPAFRLEGDVRWCVVVHPYWDVENPVGVLDTALSEEPTAIPMDSFRLSRNPVGVREELKGAS